MKVGLTECSMGALMVVLSEMKKASQKVALKAVQLGLRMGKQKVDTKVGQLGFSLEVSLGFRWERC